MICLSACLPIWWGFLQLLGGLFGVGLRLVAQIGVYGGNIILLQSRSAQLHIAVKRPPLLHCCSSCGILISPGGNYLPTCVPSMEVQEGGSGISMTSTGSLDSLLRGLKESPRVFTGLVVRNMILQDISVTGAWDEILL